MSAGLDVGKEIEPVESWKNMHVTLEKSSFLKALAHQQSVIERKMTVPILSHVLLEAKDQRLILTGTDLELCLVEPIPAVVEKPGNITLPVHTLYDIVRKLKNDHPITLSLENNGSVCLASSPSTFHLPTLPTVEFPAMDTQALPHQFKLACETLKRLMDQTRFAMSNEAARYYMNGIYLHSLNGQLRTVATDAHRLALSWTQSPESGNDMPGIIVPRKTVQELRKLLEGRNDDELLDISLSNQQLSVVIGECTLYSRLIEGQFPDYQNAIPEEGNINITLDNQTFAEAVDRVSMISQEKSRAIKMELMPGRMTLSSKNAENGFAEETLDVSYQGEPLTMGFNARYTLDVSQQMAGKDIQICFHSSQSPVLLKDPAHNQSLYVLMPVRV